MNLQQLKQLLFAILLAIILALIFIAFIKIDIEKLPSWRLPVGFVGGQIIYLNDYKDIYKILKEKNGLNKPEVIEQLNKSIKEQYIVEKYANKLKIKPIPLKDVEPLNNQEAKIKANDLSNELYGWSIEKFQHLVIKPLELRRGVVNWFYQENNLSIKSALEKIRAEEKVQEVIKANEKYTYYGFTSLDSFDPMIQLSLLNQKPDSVSDVVETETAYNLIHLQSVVVKDGLYEVGLLSFEKKLFSNWLEEKIKDVVLFTIIK